MSALEAARAGDERAFAELVAPHRRELLAHCYRLLASPEDAEEALQEALVAAWRGLPGFEGRSSVRTWLYRIATNCCLRLAERRPRRLLSWDHDHGPARGADDDLGSPVPGPVWVEPWPDDFPDPAAPDPAATYLGKEAVGVAYVAALQHLPPNQRAVLVLREVLAFSAAEVADLLGTTPQSVNSALQRARRTVAERVPGTAPDGRADDVDGAAVDAFVAAFERADVPALVRLLADDVRFTMPPLPAWFDGRDDVGAFFARRVFATPWRAVRTRCNGQPAVLGLQQVDGAFRLGALMLLETRRGAIGWIASFLDRALLARLGFSPGR